MTRLTLLAHSAEDLPALSALLQDATLRTADIAWDARRRRLVLLLNRYRHEVGGGSRVRAALRIEAVLSVQRRAWPAGEAVLPLLALTDSESRLDLSFGGGTALRLTVEAVDVVLEDLSEPWPTHRLPLHS